MANPIARLLSFIWFVLGVVFGLLFLVVRNALSRWKPRKHYLSPDLPWNGPGSRPLEQSREIFVPMSSRGRDYAYRWYTSSSHHPDANHYGRLIDKYLESLDMLDGWQNAGTVFDGFENIVTKRAPFTFTFVSIQPLIVFMSPGAVQSLGPGDERRFVCSRILDNHYYYATRVEKHPELQWFSPDLEIRPQGITTIGDRFAPIEWPEGRLILEEEDGWIVVTRE